MQMNGGQTGKTDATGKKTRVISILLTVIAVILIVLSIVSIVWGLIPHERIPVSDKPFP